MLDDRDLSAGAKFTEADLIGIPWQCIIGPKNLKEGKIEWKSRATGKNEFLAVQHIHPKFGG